MISKMTAVSRFCRRGNFVTIPPQQDRSLRTLPVSRGNNHELPEYICCLTNLEFGV